MEIFLENQFIAIERGVEVGKFRQRRHQGFEHEGKNRYPQAILGRAIDFIAERFEVGDVSLIELRDVRNHHPVAREVGFGETPDSR